MLKNGNVQKVSTQVLKPYNKNAKIHTPEQVQKIADSIKRFGFLNPILCDDKNRILAGHGRLQAAKLLGLEEVPVLYASGLTEAEKRAYTLADNRLAELAEWDSDLVRIELEELKALDFDIDLTGFDLPEEDGGSWFENRERYDNKNDHQESEEYQDFVQKFEQKKTTDDCYTPDLVYEAVAGFVSSRYGIQREDMVRPFYPGGDYEREQYPEGCVVVDNPPFSLLAKIMRFYVDHGVRFFLFAPTLTLFSGGAGSICAAIPTANSITYENGANVNTSFITNLEPEDVMVTSCPELFGLLYEANAANLRLQHAELPNYVYPDNVITAALVAKWSRYGIPFTLHKGEGVCVGQLDAQKPHGKSIYGYGFLMSDQKAQERHENEIEWEKRRRADLLRQKVEEATVWELSERERQIVAQLGGQENG